MSHEPESSRRLPRLTPRQVALVERIARGDTNIAIASDEGVTVDAIKMRVRRLLRALGARNRTHAAIIWSHLGTGRRSRGRRRPADHAPPPAA